MTQFTVATEKDPIDFEKPMASLEKDPRVALEKNPPFEKLAASLEKDPIAVLEKDPGTTVESFNPLGNIEGWSAFECASGPFGFRG